MSRLPPSFLQCILALGRPNPESLAGPAKKVSVEWTATGFLYGHILPGDALRGCTYLITNRHVVDGEPLLYLRFNPALERNKARQYACPLLDKQGQPLWCGHPDPDIDVAVLPFDFAGLRTQERLSELMFSSLHTSYRVADMRERVSEGDDVFILGFPLGAVGSFRNAPVVRRGCIAQIQELYSGHADCYLVDAEVFPGNSGGPVVLAPEVMTPAEQPAVKPALIGVAFSYLAYQDVAVSHQTGHARILFEENSGLTQVYPVDRIEETIVAHQERHKPRPKRRAPRKA